MTKCKHCPIRDKSKDSRLYVICPILSKTAKRDIETYSNNTACTADNRKNMNFKNPPKVDDIEIKFKELI